MIIYGQDEYLRHGNKDQPPEDLTDMIVKSRKQKEEIRLVIYELQNSLKENIYEY